jgi:hypothetical protein
MKLISYFVIVILFLFQVNLTPEQELFNFMLVFLGIILLIVILLYILLTSRQE